MKTIFLIFAFLGLSLSSLLSQEKESADSLVRLISASKAQLLEIDGKSFRKIEGSPARFLHNNTYLLCDTAFWNVEEDIIDAIGNVQIIQENTLLTGDRLHYIVRKDVAQFRGSLVQLIDKDRNVLRTNHLDYNTKDSVALFFYGATMRDKEGNIIESDRGVFDSEASRFTFIDDVQMFSDSLFFVSDSLIFHSDINTAFFGKKTKAWKGDNYISSDGGWYDQQNEKIFFEKDVYVQTIDYEVWSETLFYDRISINSKLENDIQILDTVNNSLILGDQLIYEGSSKYTEITKKPVIIGLTEDGGVVDSLFMTADTILYYTVRMHDIDSATIALARQRRELTEIDVFEKAKENMKKASEPSSGETSGIMGGRPLTSLVDTTKTLVSLDSLALGEPIDSTQRHEIDSLDVPIMDSFAELDTIPALILPDTTQVNFIEAYHRVKIFKTDFQVLCDSLIYTDLDSIARLYENPVLWNDITNQLTADSMQFVIENGEMRKAFLLSNAFVIAEDTPTYYNQIKAPEMVGYFNQGALTRYDAMGGVQALFYFGEDSLINTILLKETKIMSARLKDGGMERVYNLENPKNDAYSLDGLSSDEQRLKGFNLRTGRPSNRDSITTRKIRKSIRKKIQNTPAFPLFNSTAEYFPKYMDDILLEINQRSPLKWKKFDPNYVEGIPTMDALIDVIVDTIEVESVESVKEEIKDLKIDPVIPEKELSKKQKRQELRKQKRLDRKQRKIDRKERAIQRRLKRIEARELRKQEKAKNREENKLKKR